MHCTAVHGIAFLLIITVHGSSIVSWVDKSNNGGGRMGYGRAGGRVRDERRGNQSLVVVEGIQSGTDQD